MKPEVVNHPLLGRKVSYVANYKTAMHRCHSNGRRIGTITRINLTIDEYPKMVIRDDADKGMHTTVTPFTTWELLETTTST